MNNKYINYNKKYQKYNKIKEIKKKIEQFEFKQVEQVQEGQIGGELEQQLELYQEQQQKQLEQLDYQLQKQEEEEENNKQYDDKLFQYENDGIIHTRGCSRLFIILVLKEALLYCQSLSNSPDFPFEKDIVKIWLKKVKNDCIFITSSIPSSLSTFSSLSFLSSENMNDNLTSLRDYYSISFGGVDFSVNNSASYWNNPKQFFTWWKNNIERKNKFQNIIRDSENITNEKSLFRAFFCRNVVDLTNNIRNHFERNRINFGNLSLPGPQVIPPTFDEFCIYLINSQRLYLYKTFVNHNPLIKYLKLIEELNSNQIENLKNNSKNIENTNIINNNSTLINGCINEDSSPSSYSIDKMNNMKICQEVNVNLNENIHSSINGENEQLQSELESEQSNDSNEYCDDLCQEIYETFYSTNHGIEEINNNQYQYQDNNHNEHENPYQGSDFDEFRLLFNSSPIETNIDILNFQDSNNHYHDEDIEMVHKLQSPTKNNDKKNKRYFSNQPNIINKNQKCNMKNSINKNKIVKTKEKERISKKQKRYADLIAKPRQEYFTEIYPHSLSSSSSYINISNDSTLCSGLTIDTYPSPISVSPITTPIQNNNDLMNIEVLNQYQLSSYENIDEEILIQSSSNHFNYSFQSSATSEFDSDSIQYYYTRNESNIGSSLSSNQSIVCKPSNNSNKRTKSKRGRKPKLKHNLKAQPFRNNNKNNNNNVDMFPCNIYHIPITFDSSCQYLQDDLLNYSNVNDLPCYTSIEQLSCDLIELELLVNDIQMIVNDSNDCDHYEEV